MIIETFIKSLCPKIGLRKADHLLLCFTNFHCLSVDTSFFMLTFSKLCVALLRSY